MCTAISYKTNHHYFGRNLDLERGYQEGVVITPRNYPLSFRYEKTHERHYALIGMAAIANDYPLYFEATNEKGLSMAGLNFPGNAFYPDFSSEKENVAPFELIPYLLGSCGSVKEAKNRLSSINVVHCNFSEELPVSPLHWMISDKEASVTLECTKDGMKIFENPLGILTNNPTFDYHLTNINNYQGLYEGGAENRLCKRLPLENYSLGLGALHLPGDFSSASRFVKTVFVKEKSICNGGESESVNQFFHMLQAVAMPKGCVMTPSGEYEYTRYSSCCNTDKQIYYYTTYQNFAIRQVNMHDVNLNDVCLFSYAVEE